jgi:hypothetical protein
MIKFLKNLAAFLMMYCILVFLVAQLSSSNKVPDTLNPDFVEKNMRFLEYANVSHTNILLGSSMMRDAVDPNQLPGHWFQYALGGQNIYNSFKLLEYYSGVFSIDTVIVALNPFDFCQTYLKKDAQTKQYPISNESFVYFGKDSISDRRSRMLDTRLRNIQRKYFFSIEDKIKSTELSTNQFDERGYAKRKDELIALNEQATNPNQVNPYFSNIRRGNYSMEYFDLFNNYCIDKGITAIYILTPKHKSYFDLLEKSNHLTAWNNILDSIVARGILITNYERIFHGDQSEDRYFKNDSHLSVLGEKLFTSTIKEDLHELKY